jgi:hypothetical protein
MSFVTYANTKRREVTLHVADCSQIRKHGGEHSYDQGEYKDHSTYQDAMQSAQGTELSVKDCSYCKPQNQQ